MVKHDRYGGRAGCSFVVYFEKVQVSGQKWKKEVVRVATGLVSLNKVKSNSYKCGRKLVKSGKFCRHKGHFG